MELAAPGRQTLARWNLQAAVALLNEEVALDRLVAAPRWGLGADAALIAEADWNGAISGAGNRAATFSLGRTGGADRVGAARRPPPRIPAPAPRAVASDRHAPSRNANIVPSILQSRPQSRRRDGRAFHHRPQLLPRDFGVHSFRSRRSSRIRNRFPRARARGPRSPQDRQIRCATTPGRRLGHDGSDCSCRRAKALTCIILTTA